VSFSILDPGPVAAALLRRFADQHWRGAMTLRVAQATSRQNLRLAPRLERLADLVYADGGSPAEDLDGHVRSASALRRFGDRLLIVQDDVRALALRDRDREVEAVLLRPGANGRRTFDATRGNKRLKLDLEACLSLPDGRAVVFGSGSARARERVVIVGPDRAPQIKPAADFYRALRSVREFVGPALNLEGAVCHSDRVLLFQRGNGGSNGSSSVNAVGDLSLDGFLAWLDADGPVPHLQSVLQVDLGRIEGVPYGFTDGAVMNDGRIAFISCAEASADVLSDGPVLGVRFGIIDRDRTVEVDDVTGPDGRASLIKLEGIEARLTDSRRFDVVADLDRPDLPALIGELVVGEA
jgi:hypothetical protein